MISQTNSSTLGVAYQSKTTQAKETRENTVISQQGDTSKIEQLKESIGSGEYKVNVQALSQKIAESLL